MENIINKINNGEYVNRKQWVPITVDKIAHMEYKNEEDRLKLQFQNDLEKEYNLEYDIANKIFYLAWKNGHSGGYKDVLIEYDILVDQNLTIEQLKELI